MRHIFLPVHVGVGMLDGNVFQTWFDEPPLAYPHALLSYTHWKQPWPIPAAAYIFGDSGGFSLRSPTMHLSGKNAVDPVVVLRWQMATCRVGVLLDLPPNEFTAPMLVGNTRSARLWSQALHTTLAYTRRALPHYERARAAGTPFRWWGVIHGNTPEEQEEWYRAVAAIYPFADEGEGWAVRPEPTVTPRTTAQALRLCQRLGLRRVHFLAATQQRVVAVLLGLGPRAGLELATYDSAYAVKGGTTRHLFLPYADGFTFSCPIESGDDHRLHDYALHECPCRGCVFMRERSATHHLGQVQVRERKFGGWMSFWFILHNLVMQVDRYAALDRAVQQDPDGTLRYMLQRDYWAVLRAFEGSGPAPHVRTGSDRGLLTYLDE